MTRKIYKTAKGKTIDMGSLLLQNEQVRAVGNMNVNARGDLLDSGNKVIDQKNRQVQRQYKKQTNVSASPVTVSTREAKQAQVPKEEPTVEDFEFDIEEPIQTEPVVKKEEVEPLSIPRGGLAAAIARAKTVKQEPEKSLRELQKEQGLKKI
jgi:hypothetical protein